MKNLITKKIYLSSTLKKIEKKVKLLGLDSNNYDMYDFLNKRLISTMIIFIISLVILPNGLILAILFSILYYYLVEYLSFDIPIKRRSRQLESEAVYFFEALSIATTDNLNLYQALEKVTNNMDSNLSLEFKKALDEVKLGKTLSASLNSLKRRIPSLTIRRMILNLENSLNFHYNILDTINLDIAYLNENNMFKNKELQTKKVFYLKCFSFIFIIVSISLIIVCPILSSMLK